MKGGRMILRRVIEATFLGLAIGDAIGFWRNRDRLDELDEGTTLLEARLEAVERIPVIQTGLVDAVARPRDEKASGEDSAQSRRLRPAK